MNVTRFDWLFHALTGIVPAFVFFLLAWNVFVR